MLLIIASKKTWQTVWSRSVIFQEEEGPRLVIPLHVLLYYAVPLNAKSVPLRAILPVSP
jgi:hypothetical protein